MVRAELELVGAGAELVTNSGRTHHGVIEGSRIGLQSLKNVLA